MLVFTGDPYGQLHSVSVYTKEVVATYGQLTKQSPIRLISAQNDDDVYFASANKIMNYTSNQLTEVELKSGATLIGMTARTTNRVLYSYSDGSICQMTDFRGEDNEQSLLFQVSKNEGWLKGFRSQFKDQEYALIGKSLPPVIVDMEREVISWSAKNVPNDELELKTPVHDVDGLFYNQGNNLAACHKDRKIRLYDVKKGQKRPIFDKEFREEKTNFTTLTQSLCSNYFLFGNAQGSVFLADKRKQLQVFGKLKGANGGIKGIVALPNGYVMVASLDSYLRLYNLSDNKVVSSVYMGHPIYSLLVAGEIDEEQLEDMKEEQAEAPKRKAPKRKNTVALPYLQPRKQLKKQQQQSVNVQPKQLPTIGSE